MTKKDKGPRELVCQRTGRKFIYAGVGRPPKYHPDIQESIRKEQRAASQKAKREASKTKRAKAVAETRAAA